MSKQEDLKLVFQFIADYLREEDTSAVKAVPVIEESPIEDELETKEVNDDSGNFNVNRMLEIMKRLDDIDKAKANAVNMLKFDETIRNSLQRQLSELRTEHAMMVGKDIISEEKELDIILPPAEWPSNPLPISNVSVQDVNIMDNLQSSIVTTASTMTSVFSTGEPEPKDRFKKASLAKKLIKSKRPVTKRKTKK